MDIQAAIEYARPTVGRILRKHPDAVEDCLQAAAIKIHVHLDSFRGESTFKTWALRICLNQALEYLRRNKRQNDFVPLDEDLRCSKPSPETLAIRSQLRRTLVEEIKRLSPGRREAFLRSVAGEKTQSNAEKSRRFQARKILKSNIAGIL